MARLPRRELEQIVKRDLPGYRLVSRGGEGGDSGSHAEPDEVAPDIDALRRKYLGDEGEPDRLASAARGAPADYAEDDDDEIITVQADRPRDPLDSGARPKKVVVSGKSKRIIGSQG
jgi:hypothetical protein